MPWSSIWQANPQVLKYQHRWISVVVFTIKVKHVMSHFHMMSHFHVMSHFTLFTCYATAHQNAASIPLIQPIQNNLALKLKSLFLSSVLFSTRLTDWQQRCTPTPGTDLAWADLPRSPLLPPAYLEPRRQGQPPTLSSTSHIVRGIPPPRVSFAACLCTASATHPCHRQPLQSPLRPIFRPHPPCTVEEKMRSPPIWATSKAWCRWPHLPITPGWS